MIRIANAPCSWGILEFDDEGKPVPYGQMLDEMQETGYAGTELGDWGFLPTTPDALGTELAQRGLELVGAFVPVAFRDEVAYAAGEKEALRTARLLAAVAGETPFILLADDNGKDPVRTRNAGRIRPEHGLPADEWPDYAAHVNWLAGAVRDETGLRTVFHHHCAGFVETPAEVDTLLSLTNPGLVGLCLDTGHYLYGGGDPVAALKRYGNRIWHVHFKDCSMAVATEARAEGWDYFEAIRNGLFCELGQGDVDFPAVVDALRARDYDGWLVIEQDVLPGMGTPAASAARNRAYLRQIGLD